MNEKIPEFGWWIKIATSQPMYIYYFGPFNNYYEAERYKYGYIQDLSQEGSHIVDIQINQCQPKQLTTSLMPLSA